MKKLFFIFLFLPVLAHADRLGGLKMNAEVLLSTQAAGGVSGSTGTVVILIEGQGSAIVAGSTRSISMPYNGTISSYTFVADRVGSITVHISTSTLAEYPTMTDISSSGNTPALSSSQKFAAVPASWSTTTLTQGSIISAVVDQASTVQWAAITLWIIKN